MLITRVYTGSDRKSHFEDVEIELLDQGPMGSISSLWSAKGVLFRKVSGDYDLDFHNAPRRQFVVNLSGAVTIRGGKHFIGRRYRRTGSHQPQYQW